MTRPGLSTDSLAEAVVRGKLLCPDLQFEEDGHRYLRNGVELPSVTRVLSELGLAGDVTRFTDYHRQLGTARHLACELDDLGQLDESSCDPPVLNAVLGWRAWRRATGFVPDLIEAALWAEEGVAGRLDRGGYLPDGRYAIVDLKGPASLRSYGPQLALYGHMLRRRTGVVVDELLGLHLLPDGRTRIARYGDKRDLAAGLAAVTLWHWLHGG